MDDRTPIMRGRFRYTPIRGESGKDFWVVSLVLAGVMAAGMVPSIMRSGHWVIPAICVFNVVGMAIWSYWGGEMQLADVVIDESGIRRLSSGKLRKKILWQEVEYIAFGKARGGRASIVYGRAATVSYTIVLRPTPKKLMFMGTSFDNSIEQLPQLLELLNYYIRQHNIAVFDRLAYPNPEVKLRSLPLPDFR